MTAFHENEDGRGGSKRRGARDGTKSTSATAQGTSGSESDKTRKLLLGIGFWVQGLRCLPWLGVNFFLKDGLKMEPSTLQIIQNSATLPMVAKPFYGIVSDSCYILGEHRTPYIVLGAFLQAISWLAIAILPPTSVSFFTLACFLLLSNLGAAVVEVANDAIVAETTRQAVSSSEKPKSSSSGNLQSFVWMATAIGGVIGNLVGGLAIESFSPQKIFLMFGVIVSIQFLVTIFIHEKSLGLPKNPSSVGIKKSLAELLSALQKPEIAYSIAWFAASYAVIPALTGTMFFFQTEHLKIEPSVVGISKVVGQVSMLLWGVIYEQKLKSMSPRKLISGIHFTMAILMISDILFVKGAYRAMGVPDSLYVILFSGFIELLWFFKILPFSVLMAQLCPPGCEGSLMAFLMSCASLAIIVSAYLGVALASFFGVTGSNFSGLPKALLVQAACALLPLIWSSCIPEDVKSSVKSKEN